MEGDHARRCPVIPALTGASTGQGHQVSHVSHAPLADGVTAARPNVSVIAQGLGGVTCVKRGK